VPGTAGLVRLERTDPAVLAEALGTEAPASWPPPLLDGEALDFFEEELRKGPEQEGWWCWYIIHRGSGTAADALVGGIGFRGPPDGKSGMTEVGYSMLPGWEGRGLATEALRTLIGWAFRDARTKRIIAETYPGLKASIRVLEKCGFSRAGAGAEAGRIRFEITREEYEAD
jgi:RimJ/RimL family protein N-acetyltransferase